MHAPLVVRLFLGPALCAVLACSMAPVHNVVANVPAGLSSDAVAKAIKTAAVDRRWVVIEETPGEVVALLDIRQKHSATVAIRYDANHYRIDYRDSKNLDYDGSEIHENYNAWVLKLDKTIRKELQRAAR